MNNQKNGSSLNLIKNPYAPAIIGSILLLALGRILSKGFLSSNKLSSILMTTAILTMASIAQAEGISLIVMIIVVIAIGALIGFLNGIGVQVFKIVPLVMTLIMSNVVNGFAIFVTKGQPMVQVSSLLQSISKPLIGPIRILTAIVIILLVVLEIFFLRRSRYGKMLFLSGNNVNAARLCGINSKWVVILAYAISGGIAGFAGLLLVGYAGTAQMNMASSYTMLSIAAVVIGGTKLTGGKGTYVGGALGALVLILITYILQALNMAAGLRSLIQGVILVVILMINSRAPKLRQ